MQVADGSDDGGKADGVHVRRAAQSRISNGRGVYNRQGLPATPFRTDPDYRVNVNEGSGSFTAGKAVTISANPPPANQHFVKSLGDIAALDDATKASAMLTMPKAYVSLRATYPP